MDISKQNIHSARLASIPSSATDTMQPVALENLALIRNQTYEATLVGKPSIELLQGLITSPNPDAIKTAPDVSVDEDSTLWLLRVRGQLLLAEIITASRSDTLKYAPLNEGDTIWLQLRSDGSLAFRPAPALQPGLTQNLAPFLELATSRIEQQLAQTLQQQQPFSSTLSHLNPHNLTLAKPEVQGLLQHVIKVLGTKFPHQDLFKKLNTTTTLVRLSPERADQLNLQAARALQQCLNKQGLSFERTLFQNLIQRATLKPSAAHVPQPAYETRAQLQPSSLPATSDASDNKIIGPLKTLLQRFNSENPASGCKPPTSFETSTPTSVSTQDLPPKDMLRQFEYKTAQALATAIQKSGAASGQTAEIEAAIPMTPIASQNKPLTSLFDNDTDLKGSLLGLIRHLSQNLKVEAPPSNRSAPMTALEDNLQLLAHPLSFPRPIQPSAVLKANAILAQEELSTGQILRLLAGLLHRIQFNQLNSLHQTASSSSENLTTQSWMFDLPIANSSSQQFDFFQLRLDKETQHQKHEKPEEKTKIQWKVSLSFHFDVLGQINIQLRLTPPAATSVIWATQANTLLLLKKNAEHLRERLGMLGLSLQDIQYQEGSPANESRPIQASIVDTRA